MSEIYKLIVNYSKDSQIMSHPHNRLDKVSSIRGERMCADFTSRAILLATLAETDSTGGFQLLGIDI